MKIIIAGSRTLNPSRRTIDSLLSMFYLNDKITEVVSGTANGVDKAGEAWFKEIVDLCGKDSVLLKRFPADWEKHGKAAGHIRNKEMADYSDALLLIWDGVSRGSANMKENMLKQNKPVYEVILKTHNIKEDDDQF